MTPLRAALSAVWLRWPIWVAGMMYVTGLISTIYLMRSGAEDGSYRCLSLIVPFPLVVGFALRVAWNAEGLALLPRHAGTHRRIAGVLLVTIAITICIGLSVGGMSLLRSARDGVWVCVLSAWLPIGLMVGGMTGLMLWMVACPAFGLLHEPSYEMYAVALDPAVLLLGLVVAGRVWIRAEQWFATTPTETSIDRWFSRAFYDRSHLARPVGALPSAVTVAWRYVWALWGPRAMVTAVVVSMAGMWVLHAFVRSQRHLGEGDDVIFWTLILGGIALGTAMMSFAQHHPSVAKGPHSGYSLSVERMRPVTRTEAAHVLLLSMLLRALIPMALFSLGSIPVILIAGIQQPSVEVIVLTYAACLVLVAILAGLGGVTWGMPVWVSGFVLIGFTIVIVMTPALIEAHQWVKITTPVLWFVLVVLAGVAAILYPLAHRRLSTVDA